MRSPTQASSSGFSSCTMRPSCTHAPLSTCAKMCAVARNTHECARRHSPCALRGALANRNLAQHICVPQERLNAGLTVQREDPFMFRPNRSGAPLSRSRSSIQVPPSPDGEGGEAGEAKHLQMSSAGKHASPNLSGRSNRAHTVPLQMILRSRKQMMKVPCGSPYASRHNPPKDTRLVVLTGSEMCSSADHRCSCQLFRGYRCDGEGCATSGGRLLWQ
jgi:hypothetical protein